MHSTVHEKKISEYEDIVVSTAAMSIEDLSAAFMYSWIVQAFHSFGILEYVSRFYHDKYDMKYMDFYSSFVKYCLSEGGSIFAKEYENAAEYVKNGYLGKGWEHYDHALGDICWPLEEATLLRCVQDSKVLQQDILKLVKWIEKTHKYNTQLDILEDLSKFQTYILTTRDTDSDNKTYVPKYSWIDYFCGEGNLLESRGSIYQYPNKIIEKDNKLWCYKTAWWGRGPKKYKTDPDDIKVMI